MWRGLEAAHKLPRNSVHSRTNTRGEGACSRSSAQRSLSLAPRFFGCTYPLLRVWLILVPLLQRLTFERSAKVSKTLLPHHSVPRLGSACPNAGITPRAAAMGHPWPSAAKPASCRFARCVMPAFGQRGLTGRFRSKSSAKRGGLPAGLYLYFCLCWPAQPSAAATERLVAAAELARLRWPYAATYYLLVNLGAYFCR